MSTFYADCILATRRTEQVVGAAALLNGLFRGLCGDSRTGGLRPHVAGTRTEAPRRIQPEPWAPQVLHRPRADPPRSSGAWKRSGA